MSEMIEKVARAIAVSDRCDPDKLAKYDPHLMMKSYRQYAHAAIEAMREPTDTMVSAADSDWGPQLRDNWREMIDAALKS